MSTPPTVTRERPTNGTGAPAVVAMTALQVMQREESDTMLRLAREFPRDEDRILRDALAELDRAPEEAGRAFYSIPYTDHQTGKIVKVEGMTIRSAESLSRRWGNIKSGARIVHEDPEGFDIEAVAVDLETNTWVMRPQRVSKKLIRRGGGVVFLDDRRLVMALQAGISKALRNAVLGVLPAYLKSAYDKKARAIVAGGNIEGPADPKTVAAVKATFAKVTVTLAELERYCEKPAAQWTGAEIADLRGVWNAIQEGTTTVEEAFRAEPAEGAPTVVEPDALFTGAVVEAADTEGPSPAEAAKPVAPAEPAPRRGRPPKAREPEPPFTAEAVLQDIATAPSARLDAIEAGLLPSPAFAAWPKEDRQRVIRALAQRQVALSEPA